MATHTRSELVTVEEYLAQNVEGDPTQLIGGRIVMNEPRVVHSRIQMALLFELERWVRAAPHRGTVLPPVNVHLTRHDLYGPDVVWLAPGTLPDTDDVHFAPALVAEIRAPSTWRYDIGTKKRVYEQQGVGELWLLDDRGPEVLVFRRAEAGSAMFDVELSLGPDDPLTSPQLAGFSVAAGDLFPPR